MLGWAASGLSSSLDVVKELAFLSGELVFELVGATSHSSNLRSSTLMPFRSALTSLNWKIVRLLLLKKVEYML